MVSKFSIRCHLSATKLFEKHARSKLFLSSNHKNECLELTRSYWNYDQKQVPWSDKTKIYLLGTNTQDGFGIKRSLYKMKMNLLLPRSYNCRGWIFQQGKDPNPQNSSMTRRIQLLTQWLRILKDVETLRIEVRSPDSVLYSPMSPSIIEDSVPLCW